MSFFCAFFIARSSNTGKSKNKEEKEEKTGRFVRCERYVGSMSRSFYVGEDIRQEDIHAKYESGVLRLSIPKQEEKVIMASGYLYGTINRDMEQNGGAV